MPGYRLDGWGGEAATDDRDAREYQVTTSQTAVIPVVGELVHRGGGMDALSGVTSYEALQDMCVDALNDPTVSGLLLDIDSPGGEAGGVLDFAQWLAAQRGPKPIVAFVNSMACSAAYAIASAADTLLIGADAFAGSIGVVTYHLDTSGALDQAGVVVTYIYAGQHKVDGNPAQPLSAQAQAQIQGFVDTIYDRFCSVVATNRGIPVGTVRGTQAAIYQGQNAVNIGLADDIATLEEAMMATAPRSAPSGTRFSYNAPVTGSVARPAIDTAAILAKFNGRPNQAEPAAAAPTGSARPDVQGIYRKLNAPARQHR